MTTGREVTTTASMGLAPADVVENAATQAKLLMDIVEKTGCYQKIRDEKYLQVEAWETIGAFNRVHSVTRDIQPIGEGEVVGYLATVELLQDGQVVGGATMPCFFTENACKGKEGDAKHKAAMSAAQTFATSKAYRMNYSYVAILAGYQPTPAEEMTGSDPIGAVPSEKHWCKLHKVVFFKKGNMKGFAHKLEDGTWCNESDEKPSPETTTATTEPSTPVVEGIDMDWLKESVETLQWHDVVGWLQKKYELTGNRVTEIVGKMNELQKADFVNEVLTRLADPKEAQKEKPF